MARGGATSSRGRGKFKISRGGGRHFSRDLDPRKANLDESSEEESSEEESSDDDGVAPAGAAATLAPEMAAVNLKLGNTEEIVEDEQEMTRAERRALKKAQAEKATPAAKKKVSIAASESESEESEDEPRKAPAKGKGKPAPAEMSRKEREAADKKAAQERYNKLHAQGKTAEAKSDLARLREVRERREAAEKTRKALADEAAREAEEKKAKQRK